MTDQINLETNRSNLANDDIRPNTSGINRPHERIVSVMEINDSTASK